MATIKMKQISIFNLFLLFIILVGFIACDEHTPTTDEHSPTFGESSVEAVIEAKNLELDDEDIQKLKRIQELSEEYGLDYKIPENGWLHVVLAMDIEHIELQLKEIKATEQYFEKASEINEKWYEMRSEGMTTEEHENLTKQKNKELRELHNTIYENVEPVPWDLYIDEIQTYIDPDIDIDQFKKDFRKEINPR